MRFRIVSAIATGLAALSWIPTVARADETSTQTLERPRDPAPEVKPFGSRGQVALDDLAGFRFTLASSTSLPARSESAAS